MWLSIFLLVAQDPSKPSELPVFEQFPVSEVFKGVPAEPRLRSAHQRLYRTAIREGSRAEPNFAGHFTVVTWGCGSSCVDGVVVDARTGDVFEMPIRSSGFGVNVKYADGSMPSKDTFEPLSFKLNSRLLVMRGCANGENTRCAIHYYEWNAPRFRLLRSIGASPAN